MAAERKDVDYEEFTVGGESKKSQQSLQESFASVSREYLSSFVTSHRVRCILCGLFWCGVARPEVEAPRPAGDEVAARVRAASNFGFQFGARDAEDEAAVEYEAPPPGKEGLSPAAE